MAIKLLVMLSFVCYISLTHLQFFPFSQLWAHTAQSMLQYWIPLSSSFYVVWFFSKYPTGYTWLRFHSVICFSGIGVLALCPKPIVEDQDLTLAFFLLGGLASPHLQRPFSPWFSFRVFLPLAFGVSSPHPQGSGGSAYLLAALTRQVTRPSWRICDF